MRSIRHTVFLVFALATTAMAFFLNALLLGAFTMAFVWLISQIGKYWALVVVLLVGGFFLQYFYHIVKVIYAMVLRGMMLLNPIPAIAEGIAKTLTALGWITALYFIWTTNENEGLVIVMNVFYTIATTIYGKNLTVIGTAICNPNNEV